MRFQTAPDSQQKDAKSGNSLKLNLLPMIENS